MQILKKPVKRFAQHFAARLGPHTRTHASPRLLVLMYHRILPDNDDRLAFEEPGMTVSPETFNMHLGILSNYFEFIKLSEWLDRKRSGQKLPKMACAITFDDGWRDNYEFAFPLLQASQIPSTIFVVSDMIGTDALFWPERLARMVAHISEAHPALWQEPALSWLRGSDTSFGFSDITPTRQQITELIAFSKRFKDQENHDRISLIEKQFQLNIAPTKPALLNWEQTQEMINSKLVEIGSHTCNHIRLNKNLEENTIRHEIVDSKGSIEARTGAPANIFCFPNGDYSKAALKLVTENYLGAVTTRSGWNSAETDNYLLSRIGIHEDIAHDKTSFLARISGWI